MVLSSVVRSSLTTDNLSTGSNYLLRPSYTVDLVTGIMDDYSQGTHDATTAKDTDQPMSGDDNTLLGSEGPPPINHPPSTADDSPSLPTHVQSPPPAGSSAPEDPGGGYNATQSTNPSSVPDRTPLGQADESEAAGRQPRSISFDGTYTKSQLSPRVDQAKTIPSEYLVLSTILFEWADSYDSKDYRRYLTLDIPN